MAEPSGEFVDPTAFPIDFDPRVQRMRGVAVHGNTPFDVPFVSRVTDTLYVGGCETGLILPPEIQHVVSLYQWEKYALHNGVRSTLTVKMYDSLDGPDREQVLGIARWVNLCQQSGPTLVHCQAGPNRSNLVSATSLMLKGKTAADAIAMLREARSPAVLCNPTFAKWLHDLEPEHLGSSAQEPAP